MVGGISAIDKDAFTHNKQIYVEFVINLAVDKFNTFIFMMVFQRVFLWICMPYQIDLYRWHRFHVGTQFRGDLKWTSTNTNRHIKGNDMFSFGFAIDGEKCSEKNIIDPILYMYIFSYIKKWGCWMFKRKIINLMPLVNAHRTQYYGIFFLIQQYSNAHSAKCIC